MIVAVDGADLNVERRGAGPALLLIPGGLGDGRVFEDAAELLADNFTVLTYDRRGHSGSTIHDPDAAFDIAEHSGDAVAVLRANDFERGLVFGSSAGALVSLDM